ncbi:MAG: uracil-DNA glycosylase [Candidatus Vogelbacteria bacterium]|nr:uracil-DNA glycosylase [Candidatus Vogelbacteria bacterium]
MIEVEKRNEDLKKIKNELLVFKKSPLYKFRTDNKYFPVIGEGSHFAKIMLVGEAPGKNEALQGRPFCGASGRVLNQLLESSGIKREDVYITNIVKDRPPENRDPTAEEKDMYAPFLDRQIEIIQPKVIAALGRHSMEYLMMRFNLTPKLEPISQAHGKAFETKASYGQIYIVALYHPAASIYNIHLRPTLVEDFKIINSLV